MKTLKIIGYAVAIAMMMWMFCADEALGRAGYYGPAVSTWDSRASSVVAGSTLLAVDGLVFSTHSYSTNFSSTSGGLSSQFGVHYLNLQGEDRVDLFPDDDASPGAVHGVSAGAITLITRPLMERHPSGLPQLAWGAYFGAIPSALVGLDRNFISLPVVAGVGVTYAPLPWLSITPWAELGVSYNFDTYLEPEAVDTSFLDSGEEATVNDVIDVLAEALVVEHGPAVTGRGGLEVAGHLGQRWDVSAGFNLASLGVDAENRLAVGASLKVGFHWDRPVVEMSSARQR